MRLDKYLTQAGIGTRSRVKEYIRKGMVTVDGVAETCCGRKIAEGASLVTFQGTPVGFQKTVYYMLNKPAGCVSATKDRHDRTVLDLLKDISTKDLFPVGRLDKDTEGLLLLTNDGMLAHRLLSPGRKIPKQYLAKLSRDLASEQIAMLEAGVDIGEERLTLPAVFAWRDRQAKEALLTITEGKFHQVKRMFASVGCQVLALRRLSMGTLVLDEGLAPGEYRPLEPEELAKLRELAKLEDR